jgi:hypothetical protein
MAFVQRGIHVPYQLWAFEVKEDNKIAIRNEQHSSSYLHPGGNGGSNDMAFVQPGIHADYQLW